MLFSTMLIVVATFFFLVGYSGKDVESVINKFLGIAEVLDKHLSMIVEPRIREDLPNLFYVRGGFELEEDAVVWLTCGFGECVMRKSNPLSEVDAAQIMNQMLDLGVSNDQII
ncbi:hypothetical protein ACJX0J_042339, partial [Zea mays]